MDETLIWRKARASGSQGGNCVEVASTPGKILIRDSKNRAASHLTVEADEWRAFIAAVKVGESAPLS